MIRPPLVIDVLPAHYTVYPISADAVALLIPSVSGLALALDDVANATTVAAILSANGVPNRLSKLLGMVAGKAVLCRRCRPT